MNRRSFLPFASSSTPATTSPTVASPPVVSFEFNWTYERPLLPPPDPLAPLTTSTGLEPYPVPLSRAKAAHLLRRTGFGARPAEVAALEGMPASAAVAVLVQEALLQENPSRPVWADEAVPRRPARGATPEEQQAYRDQLAAYIDANNEWMQAYRSEFVQRLYLVGLREKMALFWSNHFVTETDAYERLAVYAFRYLDLLREHALGNFKDFVYAVGLNDTMLLYLNGNTNEVREPNENYARELLELFTMGQETIDGAINYTQTDIEELARALTGWVVDPFALEVYFVPERYDAGGKTILGQTGPFGYSAVIDLIFEERAQQIAEFICGKLYAEFIYAAPDPAIVKELAQVFLAHGFEIAPVLETLLSSAHFFDDEVGGAQIKSPIATMVGLLKESAQESYPPRLFTLLDRYGRFMQQRLLDPPNVAGWPGHHNWLDTNTFPIRWEVSSALLFSSRLDQPPLDLVPMAEELHDPFSPLAVFDLPRAMAEHLLPVPLDALNLDGGGEFGGDLQNNPLPQEIVDAPLYVQDLAKIFLAGVPWYEWNLYLDEAAALLLNFARYLTNLPEYQLM